MLIDVQRGGPSTGMPTRTQQSDVLACAYASHGDTKHVLLFPEDPTECFEFTAQAFDLAERLQTPVFVMTDLDIGMNTRLCEPFHVGRRAGLRPRQGDVIRRPRVGPGFRALSRRRRRRHSVSAPIRARIRRAARYFTRGTTKDRYARYSEAGPDYVDNMQRLLRKFETAKSLVPKPLLYPAEKPARFGAIFYGSTSPAMQEALNVLAERGIHVNALRVRAFPFQEEINDFVAIHPWVFVIEQNRDAQLKSLLVNEAKVNPTRLISILHYDGTPITARFIVDQISQHAAARTVVPLKRAS